MPGLRHKLGTRPLLYQLSHLSQCCCGKQINELIPVAVKLRPAAEDGAPLPGLALSCRLEHAGVCAQATSLFLCRVSVQRHTNSRMTQYFSTYGSYDSHPTL